MPGISVDYDYRGPYFTTRIGSSVDELIRDMRWEVAGAAESEVSMLLDASIRNPTPYYETQIIRERFIDHDQVHDRGIIYGPWLEGVSSRNQTTRFKGYHSFRRATQAVDARVPHIVDRTVDRWIARMN